MEDGVVVWSDVKESWTRYTEAVDAWLDVAEKEAHPELDERIHAVIHAHNTWSEELGQVIEETHQH